MKSFQEAYQYLRDTDEEKIATRTAIIGAYYNYVGFNFGHDYILDITAALNGPFYITMAEDDDLRNMLEYINFGFTDKWVVELRKYVHEYATNKHNISELESYYNIEKILFSGKGDRILEKFNYITKVLQPDMSTYFPELYPFGNNDNSWPRI